MERQERLVTIFLDFDGVLTPLPADRRSGFDWLANVPAFEAAVRPWLDQIEIIVSSSWRFALDLVDIQSAFSADVACRIVSVTGRELNDRCKEIREWLGAHERESWLAIDDDASPFSDCRNNLIEIDRTTGFTAKEGQVLGEKLRALLEREGTD